MIPKEYYSRANGMMSLVEFVPGVMAPILAGVLLPIIGLTGILGIDMITFIIAIVSLSLVHNSQPIRTLEGESGRGNILQEATYGFKYIFARRGLLGLLTFFICLNFVIGLSISLIAPFILSRTGNNSATLGIVQSAAAVGSVIGGLLISLWGGFKRRMTSMFIGEMLTGFFLLLIFGLGRSLTVWVIAAVLGGIFPIFTNGARQAIWQAKVAPDVQGRVFSARRMIAWSVGPITPILAGLLADYVTEPAMRSGSWLARIFVPFVGASPGSGMALQFVITGVMYMMVTAYTFLFVPHVRNLEDALPDHDQMQKVDDSPLPITHASETTGA